MQNTLVAVLRCRPTGCGIATPASYARTQSLLSDCSVMRWLCLITAPLQALWRVVWASSWHFVAARRVLTAKEVLTMRPRASDTARGFMRESAAACDYLAAADEAASGGRADGGPTLC